VATLHEPIAILLHAMTFAKPALGETAVIFGAGPIGLTALGVLKLSGVARVWMVEPLAHRRALARQLGAEVVVDPGAVDPVKEIWKETGNRGADIVLDCATRNDTINQSIRLARPTGRVGIIGVPEVIQPEIEFHILRKRELTFFATRRYNDTAPAALRLLTEHTAQFAPMLTHERGLHAGQQAFEMVAAYADGVGKAVLTPSAP
jgi:L-iditol 2-dehydrogenase